MTVSQRSQNVFGLRPLLSIRGPKETAVKLPALLPPALNQILAMDICL